MPPHRGVGSRRLAPPPWGGLEGAAPPGRGGGLEAAPTAGGRGCAVGAAGVAVEVAGAAIPAVVKGTWPVTERGKGGSSRPGGEDG